MELSEILDSSDYQNANQATKRAIFDRRIGNDDSFKSANEATQNAIRQRWGITVEQPEQKGLTDRLIEGAKNIPKAVVEGLTPSPVIPLSEQAPIDPNAPFMDQVAARVQGNMSARTSKPIVGPAVMGAGGAIVKGLGAVGEFVLPNLGFSKETTRSATQPFISGGNKILETAKGYNNPAAFVGQMAPYAALPMRGVTAPFTTGAASYATTPDEEDRAVAGILGGGLHAAGLGATNAVRVPYKLGQGALNVGRGEVGGVNSAINVFTPEQKLAIQGLQEIGEISPLRNAMAQRAGQAPKPGKYLESIGESIARDILQKPGSSSTLMDFGPTVAGALYGGVPGAIAGAGISLGRRAISPALTGKLLEKIETTPSGARVNGIEVISDIAGTKFTPEVPTRNASNLTAQSIRDAADQIQPVQPAVPTGIQASGPVAPTITDRIVQYRTAQPNLSKESIESSLIQVRKSEIMKEAKDAGTPLSPKAANELAAAEVRKEYSALELREKMARVEESNRLAVERRAAEEQARIAYENSPEGIAKKEQARLAEEKLTAEKLAAEERDRISNEKAKKLIEESRLNKNMLPQPTAAIEPTPLAAPKLEVTPPTLTPPAVEPTPLQKINKELQDARVQETKNMFKNMGKNDLSFGEQLGMNEQMAGVRNMGRKKTAIDNYARQQLGEKYQYFEPVLELNPSMKATDVVDYIKNAKPDEVYQYLVDNGLQAEKIKYSNELFDLPPIETPVPTPKAAKKMITNPKNNLDVAKNIASEEKISLPKNEQSLLQILTQQHYLNWSGGKEGAIKKINSLAPEELRNRIVSYDTNLKSLERLENIYKELGLDKRTLQTGFGSHRILGEKFTNKIEKMPGNTESNFYKEVSKLSDDEIKNLLKGKSK
jgi:hypothetical protein